MITSVTITNRILVTSPMGSKRTRVLQGLRPGSALPLPPAARRHGEPGLQRPGQARSSSPSFGPGQKSSEGIMGILVLRALLFWVYVEAPDFWKLPGKGYEGSLLEGC